MGKENCWEKTKVGEHKTEPISDCERTKVEKVLFDGGGGWGEDNGAGDRAAHEIISPRDEAHPPKSWMVGPMWPSQSLASPSVQ